MMPRRYLLGLVEVPRWGYRSGFTVAQIQLMSADVPIVVYKKERNGPKPGEKGFQRTAEQAKKAYDAWKARQDAEKKSRGRSVGLDDFLGGK